MKRRIHTILKHPIVSGGAILFFGSILANLFNFLFNLFMSRNLNLPDYGLLASLISLLTLSTLPAGAMVPALVYFSASYFAKGKLAMVRGLFLRVTKISFIIGTVLFLSSVIFANQIGQFFKIANPFLIISSGFIVYFGYISVANAPLLQAKLVFKFLAFVNTLSTFLKLSLGILFVFLGFSVSGVLWALFIASLIPYVLSFIPLRFLFNKTLKTPKISFSRLVSYGGPAAIAAFATTSFITTDIILVKHFFDPDKAGIYATLSLVGRVIFFFSAPISAVMFPHITQKHTRNEDYHNDFRLSLLLVLVPSILISIFYFTFPQFAIKVFSKNDQVLLAAPQLGIFALFITAYSLLFLMTNFYLSIKKTFICIPLAIGALLQITLIWFYHETFLQVIEISLSITILLLVILLLYYKRLYGKRIQ